jgi:hypothetical protein
VGMSMGQTARTKHFQHFDHEVISRDIINQPFPRRAPSTFTQ